MRFVPRLVVALATIAASSAPAQNIKPRVVLMVDTSGSMTSHLNNNTTTGGDGSFSYTDAGGAIENTFYRGVKAGSFTCGFNGCAANNVCTGAFDGVNSRLFAAKA